MTKQKSALTAEQINRRASVISKKIAAELSDFVKRTGKVIAEIKVTSWAERDDKGDINLRQNVNIQYGDISVTDAPAPANRVPAQVKRV